MHVFAKTGFSVTPARILPICLKCHACHADRHYGKTCLSKAWQQMLYWAPGKIHFLSKAVRVLRLPTKDDVAAQASGGVGAAERRVRLGFGGF